MKLTYLGKDELMIDPDTETENLSHVKECKIAIEERFGK